MTITAYDVLQLTAGVVLVTVTSDLSPGAGESINYHWYQDGAYVGRTDQNSRTFAVQSGEQVVIDVNDTLSTSYDPIANAPDGYPSRRSVWFIRSLSDDVARYALEQRIGAGAWEQVSSVPAVPGQWAYSLLSGVLPDLSDVDLRVVPYDGIEQRGSAPKVTGIWSSLEGVGVTSIAATLTDVTADETLIAFVFTSGTGGGYSGLSNMTFNGDFVGAAELQAESTKSDGAGNEVGVFVAGRASGLSGEVICEASFFSAMNARMIVLRVEGADRDDPFPFTTAWVADEIDNEAAASVTAGDVTNPLTDDLLVIALANKRGVGLYAPDQGTEHFDLLMSDHGNRITAWGVRGSESGVAQTLSSTFTTATIGVAAVVVVAPVAAKDERIVRTPDAPEYGIEFDDGTQRVTFDESSP